MQIKPEHLEQLELEVQHIFDSGANEVRVYNMIQSFIEKRGAALFIDSVSNWISIDDNQDLYVKTIEENPRTEIMFDDGSVVRYFEDWPYAEAVSFRIKQLVANVLV